MASGADVLNVILLRLEALRVAIGKLPLPNEKLIAELNTAFADSSGGRPLSGDPSLQAFSATRMVQQKGLEERREAIMAQVALSKSDAERQQTVERIREVEKELVAISGPLQTSD